MAIPDAIQPGEKEIYSDGSIVDANGNAICHRAADGACKKLHADIGIEQVILPEEQAD